MTGQESNPKSKRGFGYWFPRLLVISLVLSVWLNLPKYLHGMDERQYVVWLARVAWVVGVPLIFAVVIGLIGRWRGR